MVSKRRKKLKFALLLENGSELLSASMAIRYFLNHDYSVVVLSTNGYHIRSWNNDNWGDMLTVNEQPAKNSEGYDGLFIPGGMASSLTLRSDSKTVQFVRSFLSQKKILIAENYAVQVLLECASIKNYMLTSPQAIKTDVINAGCKWSDDEVCYDGNLITCQKSLDLGQVLQLLIKPSKES